MQRVTRGGIGRRRGGSLLKLEWVDPLCMEGNNACLGRALPAVGQNNAMAWCCVREAEAGGRADGLAGDGDIRLGMGGKGDYSM